MNAPFTSVSYEENLHGIREFVHRRQKEILDDFLGRKNLIALFRENTSLAEMALERASAVTSEEVSRKYPDPKGGFVIVAMGKLGGRELNFHSDLDLMFFYEETEDIEYYAYFVRRLITTLSLLTQDGYAYQIDTELRPSGNSGLLLSTLSSWKEYGRQGLQLWEKQALLKARPLLILAQPKPNPRFHEELSSHLDEVRYRPIENSPDTARELYTMRLRIQNELSREKKNVFNLKTGYGGLIDIEFLTQYLQLLHSDKNDLRTTNTLEALSQLGRLGFLATADAEQLTRIYLYYRELEAYFRITLQKSTDEIRSPSEVTHQVEQSYYGGKNIVDTYLPTREIVRSVYLRVLGISS